MSFPIQVQAHIVVNICPGNINLARATKGFKQQIETRASAMDASPNSCLVPSFEHLLEIYNSDSEEDTTVAVRTYRTTATVPTRSVRPTDQATALAVECANDFEQVTVLHNASPTRPTDAFASTTPTAVVGTGGQVTALADIGCQVTVLHPENTTNTTQVTALVSGPTTALESFNASALNAPTVKQTITPITALTTGELAQETIGHTTANSDGRSDEVLSFASQVIGIN